MSAIGTKRTFAFAPHMSAFGESGHEDLQHRGQIRSSRAALPCGRHTAKYAFMGRPIRPFDKWRSAKKRIATVTRKLGILINCRVQKPFLKDLDAYRKSLKLSRPAALVKLATEQLAGLKEPAEKLWEGAVERMFPEASGVKGDDPK